MVRKEVLAASTDAVLAFELQRRNIPFFFMTGQCTNTIADFAHVPVLMKPVSVAKIQQTIEYILS